MNCLLLVLAVFLAVASAQSTCYAFQYKCVGEGAVCDLNVTSCSHDSSNKCRICSFGGIAGCSGSSSTGTCVAGASFKESCDSTHLCTDDTYPLVCVGGICGGTNVFLPGENCDGAGSDNWVTSSGGVGSGGCAITKCDASSNKCAGAGSGGACAGNCTGGLYCDFSDISNPACAAWKKSGSCASAAEVAPTYDCIGGTVVKKIFSC